MTERRGNVGEWRLSLEHNWKESLLVSQTFRYKVSTVSECVYEICYNEESLLVSQTFRYKVSTVSECVYEICYNEVS